MTPPHTNTSAPARGQRRETAPPGRAEGLPAPAVGGLVAQLAALNDAIGRTPALAAGGTATIFNPEFLALVDRQRRVVAALGAARQAARAGRQDPPRARGGARGRVGRS